MKEGWIAIIVGIIGAASTLIVTQVQETTRFELAQEERSAQFEQLIEENRAELRKELILLALANPEVERQRATLRFLVDTGLLEDENGKIRAYFEDQETLGSTLAPFIDPELLRDRSSALKELQQYMRQLEQEATPGTQ